MECEFCGSNPAQRILLQSASSRILWWNHRKVDASLCGLCAERLFYDQQSRNLIQGWWGPLSALATVWFTCANSLRIGEHRRSITKVEVDSGTIDRPRLRITSNRPAMVISGIALLIIFSIASTIASAPTPVSDSTPDSYLSTWWLDQGDDILSHVGCDSEWG